MQFVRNVLFLFRHNPQIIFLQTACFCGRPRWSDVLEIKTEMFKDEEKYMFQTDAGGNRGGLMYRYNLPPFPIDRRRGRRKAMVVFTRSCLHVDEGVGGTGFGRV